MQLNGLTGREKRPADVPPDLWRLPALKRPSDDRPPDPRSRTLFPEIERLLSPSREH